MGVVPYHMLPRPGATEYFDEESKAGYSYDPVKGIVNTYDTVPSVLEKCKIVHEKNLKGIIVWESSGNGNQIGTSRCLISAMKRGLFDQNFSSTSPVPQPTPQPS